jgi:hypothetical protein
MAFLAMIEFLASEGASTEIGRRWE